MIPQAFIKARGDGDFGDGTEYIDPPLTVFQIDNLGLNEATAQWENGFNNETRILRNVTVNPKELVLYVEGTPDTRIILGDYITIETEHPLYKTTGGYVTAIECDRMSSDIYTKYTVFLPLPYFFPVNYVAVHPRYFSALSQQLAYDSYWDVVQKYGYYVYHLFKNRINWTNPSIIYPHSFLFSFTDSAGQEKEVTGYWEFKFNYESKVVKWPDLLKNDTFKTFQLTVLDTGFTVEKNGVENLGYKRALAPYFKYLQQYNYEIYLYSKEEININTLIKWSDRRFI